MDGGGGSGGEFLTVMLTVRQRFVCFTFCFALFICVLNDIKVYVGLV